MTSLKIGKEGNWKLTLNLILTLHVQSKKDGKVKEARKLYTTIDLRFHTHVDTVDSSSKYAVFDIYQAEMTKLKVFDGAKEMENEQMMM